mmetsp:Transcript_32859/g.47556  ORF Transcript_32859/g.47556 Transcript_32859/m.47556 type:complete len:229 (+) Transcript_32859:625-1311(+)
MAARISIIIMSKLVTQLRVPMSSIMQIILSFLMMFIIVMISLSTLTLITMSDHRGALATSPWYTRANLYFSVALMVQNGSMICMNLISRRNYGVRLRLRVIYRASVPVQRGLPMKSMCTFREGMMGSIERRTFLHVICPPIPGKKCRVLEALHLLGTFTRAVYTPIACMCLVGILGQNVCRICLCMILIPIIGAKLIVRMVMLRVVEVLSLLRFMGIACTYSVVIMAV